MEPDQSAPIPTASDQALPGPAALHSALIVHLAPESAAPDSAEQHQADPVHDHVALLFMRYIIHLYLFMWQKQ